MKQNILIIYKAFTESFIFIGSSDPEIVYTCIKIQFSVLLFDFGGKYVKKMISAVAALLIATTMLSGCGAKETATEPAASAPEVSEAVTSSENPETTVSAAPSVNGAEEIDVESLKTLGDIFALENSIDHGSLQSEKTYTQTFEYNEIFYTVTAELPDDVYNQLEEIDFFDKQKDEKKHALLAPVEIKTIENRSKKILPQEELEKLVGKTGEDLLNEGWVYVGDYSLNEFCIDYDQIQYEVTFNESVDKDLFDSLPFYQKEEAIKPLTVKSVEFDNIF